MRGDVVGPVALDLVLRIVGRRAMAMPLVVEVGGVDRDDRAGHVAGFGIPADVVAQPEWRGHAAVPPCVDARWGGPRSFGSARREAGREGERARIHYRPRPHTVKDTDGGGATRGCMCNRRAFHFNDDTGVDPPAVEIHLPLKVTPLYGTALPRRRSAKFVLVVHVTLN